MYSVRLIEEESELQAAFAIRREVFVKGQKVAPEEEFDAYETTSFHFLAVDAEGTPIGTGRWRFTDKGIKIERIAVMEAQRGKGVGAQIMDTLMAHIARHPESGDHMIYMHAQVQVVDFYRPMGFRTVGDVFDECGIMHYKMMLD